VLKKPIALQTFTVRDDLAKDFKGTIEQVAKMGYAGIELGGDTGGMAPAECRKFLDGLGLKVLSWHAPIEQLSGDTQAVIDYAQVFGLKFVGCPFASGQRAADYYQIAKTLEKAGATLKDAGLRLVYHNHAHELTRFGGHYAIDIILANSKHDCLAWELDTFWVKTGGEEPQDYIRKYAGRVPLLHLKDRTAGPNPTFAEVGEGTLNWTEIFSAADEAGTEWYIVEQDTCQRPPLESAHISLNNLRKMGVAG
jgi:sugar phosphate isomerase/epimerase